MKKIVGIFAKEIPFPIQPKIVRFWRQKNLRVFFFWGGRRGDFLLPLSRYQPVWQRLESDEQQIVLATLEQGKILQNFLEVNLPRVTDDF